MNKKDKKDLFYNFLERYKNCTHDTQEEWEYDEDEEMYCINYRCKKCKVIIKCVYTKRKPSETDIVTNYPIEKQLKCKVCEKEIGNGMYCSDCMKEIAFFESDMYFRTIEGKTKEEIEEETKEEIEEEINNFTYIYKCGLDELTGNYETTFDATYDNKKCIILKKSCFHSLVRFEDDYTAVVQNMYLEEQ